MLTFQMQVLSRYRTVKLFLKFVNVMSIACVCAVREGQVLALTSGTHHSQMVCWVPEWQSGFS